MPKEHLPSDIAAAVSARTADWPESGKVARLWNRDKTLWTAADEDKWLGRPDIADRQLAQRDRFTSIAADVKAKGCLDAVLPGMGGSSLCPEVLFITFGREPGFPATIPNDVPIPGQKYTFGIVKAARAEAIPTCSKGHRRALRVRIKGDLREGLAKLQTELKEAL